MRPPTEFLQGFGIGAGLIAVMAAISLFYRPGLPGPGQMSPEQPGKTAAATPASGRAPATLPDDYLDVCRNAGLL